MFVRAAVLLPTLGIFGWWDVSALYCKIQAHTFLNHDPAELASTLSIFKPNESIAALHTHWQIQRIYP
jgi:hypothetical protein